MGAAGRARAFAVAVAFGGAAACSGSGSGGHAAPPVPAVATTGGGTSTTTGTTPLPTPVPLPPPAPTVGAPVRLLGRFTTMDPNAQPVMAWPASRAIVGFTGTKLSVTLTEIDYAGYGGVDVNNYFSVRIDGGAPTVFTLVHGANTVTLASKLAAGAHLAVLSKRTEAQIGRTQLGAFVTDGSLTATPPPSARRLQVVGDSGPAGYGTDGIAPCDFTPATEDADQTFPMLAGEALGADVHNLSFSGKGVYQNIDPVNDAVKTLPVLWQYIVPNDPAPWDHSQWVPQAVVVLTGGNDFHVSTPDAAAFSQVAGKFLATIRATYPAAHVWFAASPLAFDGRDVALGYVQSTVAQLADDHVHVLTLPVDDGSRGRGCNGHLVPATQALVGQALAAGIRTTLGW